MSKRKKSLRRPNVPTAAATPAGAAPRRETFAADYEYVKKDLKRIGILAGSFIAALIALSFFIR